MINGFGPYSIGLSAGYPTVYSRDPEPVASYAPANVPLTDRIVHIIDKKIDERLANERDSNVPPFPSRPFANG
jgi:hypothetical protein